MVHDGLTESILKACFQVSNELGAGFVESVYEKALLVALLINFGNPRLEYRRINNRLDQI